MKLRTRLFLWVGTLFFLAFAVSLIFENYITDQSLEEAEENLRGQITELAEKKRESIEQFLHVSLVETQALVDSLLVRLSRGTGLGNALFLDAKDLALTAPSHSALLFQKKNWIDFIQSTKNGKQTSLLIPMEFPLAATHYIPLEDQFGWVILDCDRQFDRPFIGVKFTNSSEVQRGTASVEAELERDFGLTVLFHPEALKDFKRPDGLEVPEGSFLSGFLENIEKAAGYLASAGRGDRRQIQEEIRAKLGSKHLFSSRPLDRASSSCVEAGGQALKRRVTELLEKGDQAIMISALVSLFPSGAFGPSLASKSAPLGIARFPNRDMSGQAVFLDQVLLDQRVFDDGHYMIESPARKECKGIGGSIAVIVSDKVFVGNTLALQSGENGGFLTIGVDVGELVQDLVFSAGQAAFLVHNGKVVSGFTKEGVAIEHPSKELPFQTEMLRKKSGLICWKGTSYSFLHMTPFKNVDLHFFTLEPEQSAFTLVRSIDEGSRSVIEHISFNMRVGAVVALCFVLMVLHRISRRITGPISRLAKVTHDVVEGNLEGIELPAVPERRRDEVATLISSFDQMIVGLKEKEKVKGVLSKVVSPEIAQEITKGTVHLGGEEKKVTVLFGDIRNFTRISSHKSPIEVIELLNTCMTKVSHEIDEFGGVIDKYVGDEVMALFGAPLEKEDSALSAVLAALKMVDVLQAWNVELEKEGRARIEMGFGIHTGLVLAGNMGAENRLNYTVIGSNVNFASRLCSAAKGMEILMSKETLEEPHVKESIDVEECPPIHVKGYDEAFVVYRVRGARGEA